MRLPVKLFFLAACVWVTGCEEQSTKPVSGAGIGLPIEMPDSAAFTETIDLTIGTQVFHSVDVLGTIYFEITPSLDSSSAAKRAARKPYEVFIHTEMRFRRSQDYTMEQDWRAGGKSGDRMMLEDGSIALLFKSYRIWSIPNEAYINMFYGVTPAAVGLRILWVSYEPVTLQSQFQPN